MKKEETENKLSLLDALRENDKKNLFSTNSNSIFLKTGFHLYDYFFGSVINIHDKDGNIIKQEPRVGQAIGTLNLIIGNTGSGKTTFAIQLAANLIRPYENGQVIHYDCEQRTDLSRIENISKLPGNFFYNNRYIFKTGMVGLDIIKEMIVKVYTNKMKLKDQIMVETEFEDEFGNKMKMFPPTVIIIDSITSVIEETFSWENQKEVSDMEKLQSNTDGARSAKSLKGFFKDILPLCKESNIIIYAINHINTNMSMNAFIPVGKQQNYLKQDESIPGGKTMLYYPFNIIKMIAKPNDDFTEATHGFNGHIVMVEPIKSSSNQSGNNSKGIAFELVFSFKDGFDPLRSLIHYGITKGIIEGNRNRLKFKDSPDFIFALNKIDADNETRRKIWELIRTYLLPDLKSHLSFVEPTKLKFDPDIMNY